VLGEHLSRDLPLVRSERMVACRDHHEEDAGKSFIGALVAKILHDWTQETIIVCCYTNHALDQFLEDLLDIGIPEDSIVRLGGKSTLRTEPLSLFKQQRVNLARADWNVIDDLKAMASTEFTHLEGIFREYTASSICDKDIMDYLEFEERDYFEAFQVPDAVDEDGMQLVGRDGKPIGPFYLFSQWTRGWDAGLFKCHPYVLQFPSVWNMKHPSRQSLYAKWKEQVLKEQVKNIYDIGQRYNDYQARLEREFVKPDTMVLSAKRIIGCTTTAAAKYTENLKAVSPGVL